MPIHSVLLTSEIHGHPSNSFGLSLYIHNTFLLRPKSPSELWPSFRSGTQPSTVLWPSSVRPITPPPLYHFCLFAHPPFLIPFPHTFHVSNIHLVSCSLPQTPFRTPNPKPQTPFHSTLHHVPLFYFHPYVFVRVPLLLPFLCSV